MSFFFAHLFVGFFFISFTGFFFIGLHLDRGKSTLAALPVFHSNRTTKGPR
jgi:hypothetical protein